MGAAGYFGSQYYVNNKIEKIKHTDILLRDSVEAGDPQLIAINAKIRASPHNVTLLLQ